MVISAKEIAANEKLRRDVRKETYKALLEQFSRKIKTQSEIGNKFTDLTVPPFLIGFPRYNIPKTVEYMVRQLVRLGYTVQRTGPINLRISWGRAPSASVPVEDAPEDILPGLANLQKTAQKLRITKHS
jgi:hypothetical protein